MCLPKVGELYWLFKEKNKHYVVLGFLIDKDNFGCFIIGGPTGSYLSGHGERWQDKWQELLLQGYIPESEAKGKRIISKGWKHPKINREDQEIIGIITNITRKGRL